MAIEHLNLAFKADIAKSSCKFLLVALADYANEVGEAYPSVETLCRKTALNRKTVIRCLQDLVDMQAIKDSGRRHGRTQRICVWKLTIQNIKAVPKTGQLSSTKNGTVSEGEIDPILDINSPKNGTAKQSQNWDIEPSDLLTPRSEPSETTSHAMRAREENAVFVLSYLNKKSKSRFQPVEANLRLIRARLDEGHSPDDLTGVVDMQCEKWRDSKMAQYLRPATLFNAEKFNQYIGVLPVWIEEMSGVPDWARESAGHTYDGEVDDD